MPELYTLSEPPSSDLILEEIDTIAPASRASALLMIAERVSLEERSRFVSKAIEVLESEANPYAETLLKLAELTQADTDDPIWQRAIDIVCGWNAESKYRALLAIAAKLGPEIIEQTWEWIWETDAVDRPDKDKIHAIVAVIPYAPAERRDSLLNLALDVADAISDSKDLVWGLYAIVSEITPDLVRVIGGRLVEIMEKRHFKNISGDFVTRITQLLSSSAHEDLLERLLHLTDAFPDEISPFLSRAIIADCFLTQRRDAELSDIVSHAVAELAIKRSDGIIGLGAVTRQMRPGVDQHHVNRILKSTRALIDDGSSWLIAHEILEPLIERLGPTLGSDTPNLAFEWVDQLFADARDGPLLALARRLRQVWEPSVAGRVLEAMRTMDPAGPRRSILEDIGRCFLQHSDPELLRHSLSAAEHVGDLHSRIGVFAACASRLTGAARKDRFVDVFKGLRAIPGDMKRAFKLFEIAIPLRDDDEELFDLAFCFVESISDESARAFAARIIAKWCVSECDAMRFERLFRLVETCRDPKALLDRALSMLAICEHVGEQRSKSLIPAVFQAILDLDEARLDQDYLKRLIALTSNESLQREILGIARARAMSRVYPAAISALRIAGAERTSLIAEALSHIELIPAYDPATGYSNSLVIYERLKPVAELLNRVDDKALVKRMVAIIEILADEYAVAGPLLMIGVMTEQERHAAFGRALAQSHELEWDYAQASAIKEIVAMLDQRDLRILQDTLNVAMRISNLEERVRAVSHVANGADAEDSNKLLLGLLLWAEQIGTETFSDLVCNCIAEAQVSKVDRRVINGALKLAESLTDSERRAKSLVALVKHFNSEQIQRVVASIPNYVKALPRNHALDLMAETVKSAPALADIDILLRSIDTVDDVCQRWP